MAITLDELLGRNQDVNTAEDQIGRFPSYDEYAAAARRASAPAQNENTYSYDFGPRPYTPPRSVETARNYEASRPYVAPRINEYNSAAYDYAERRSFVNPAQNDDYRQKSDYGYEQYESFAKSGSKDAAKQMSLYEFTAGDRDRLSDAELYGKLSHSDAGRRPVFDRTAAVRASENTTRQSSASRSEALVSFKKEVARKARLNTKGKIILAVYIAVIVLVAVLIIVNAGAINDGRAQTPSSSVLSTVDSGAKTAVSLGNNYDGAQIHFVYEPDHKGQSAIQ